MRRIPAALLIMASLALPARAENLVLSLSSHRQEIASNFVGSQIVLFGSIERDAQTIGRPGGYDIAVVVRGPRARIETRLKERVVGVWMNTQSRQFLEAPTAYQVLANKPAAELASIETRRRLQIGFDGLTLIQRARPGEDPTTGEPFRQAFMRLNVQRALYKEDPAGVTFLTPTLFRATIAVPPNTPVGDFEVETFLFVDQAMVARAQTNFEIVKTGFEAYVANNANTHGIWYGLATAVLAIVTGWFASVVFRRD